MLKLTKSLVGLQGTKKLQHHQDQEIGSVSQSNATGGCYWRQRTQNAPFSLKDILYSIFFIYNIIFNL